MPRAKPAAASRAKPKASKEAAQTSRTGGRGSTLSVRRPKTSPQTAKSKTEQAMEAQLAALEVGTPRHRVLCTAIDFKRSWLSLAQQLSEVERNGAYRDWGYRTFDAYAKHELHLRKETAQKLLRSYNFLNDHERGLLDGGRRSDNVVPLPSYQALDVLAEARANPNLAEDDYRDVRDQVFSEDPTAAQVRKFVRERAPEPARRQEADPQVRLRKCLSLAERLYGLLCEEEDLPEALPRKVEQVVGGLRKILDEA